MRDERTKVCKALTAASTLSDPVQHRFHIDLDSETTIFRSETKCIELGSFDFALSLI